MDTTANVSDAPKATRSTTRLEHIDVVEEVGRIVLTAVAMRFIETVRKLYVIEICERFN